MIRRANPICRGSPQRHRDHRGGLSFLEIHDLDLILRALRVSVVDSLETNQISPVGGCTNKANLAGRPPRPAASGPRRPLYKQTQSGVLRRERTCRYERTKPICPAVPGSVVQTNPIWASPGGFRRPILRNKANSGGRPGRNVPNKAKLGRAGVSGGGRRIKQGNSAKQSQLPEAGPRGGVRLRRVGRGLGGEGRCTNKPNPPIADCGLRIADWGTDLSPPAYSGRLRQTNPIRGHPTGVREAILPNKPNSGRASGSGVTKCAKQSQLGMS
jgi:hypothetical protein